MQSEHAHIRGLLERIAGALAAASPSWRTDVAELEEVLGGHNVKEERVLYPMANDVTRESADRETLRVCVESRLDR